MTDVPIGERPPQGGRVKRYEDAATRAKAWRERRKAGQEGAADEAPLRTDVPPDLAAATLAALLDEIRRATEERVHLDGVLALRIEDAVAAIADPEAVGAALDAARANAQEVVAAAEARATSAEQRRVTAEAAQRAAEAQAAEASAVTDELDQANEALEGAIAQLREELAAEQAARVADSELHRSGLDEMRHEHAAELDEVRARHDQAIDDLQAELTAAHVTALDELRAQHHTDIEQRARQHAEVVEQARAEREELLARSEAADEARARAEGEAAALHREIEQIRTDLVRLREELASEQIARRTDAAAHAAAFEELRERLTRDHQAAFNQARNTLEESHRAQLAAAEATAGGDVARLEGELAASQARLAAAEEIAETYRRSAGLTRPPESSTRRRDS
jgi:DNA repair exonuclease SbcCD ATPase subunit